MANTKMPRPQRRQARAAQSRMRPPRHWLHQSCSYKRVSSVGPFYDGLRAARWRAERFLGLLAARGSGCALKTSRVSCLMATNGPNPV